MQIKVQINPNSRIYRYLKDTPVKYVSIQETKGATIAHLSGGGGGIMSYTTFGTWGRGDEGDTKLNFFTFDLVTLSK